MKHIYKILLMISLIPAVSGISCRGTKLLAELNWLPDVIETQTKIASYLEVAYNPQLKEELKAQLTKKPRKLQNSDFN